MHYTGPCLAVAAPTPDRVDPIPGTDAVDPPAAARRSLSPHCENLILPLAGRPDHAAIREAKIDDLGQENHPEVEPGHVIGAVHDLALVLVLVPAVVQTVLRAVEHAQNPMYAIIVHLQQFRTQKHRPERVPMTDVPAKSC